MRSNPVSLSGKLANVQERLVSYLEDNQDQIVESWLTGAVVPECLCNMPAADCDRALLRFIKGAMEAVLLQLGGHTPPNGGWTRGERLLELLDATGWCPCDGSQAGLCAQLRQAGSSAFESVLSDVWDSSGEFSPEERAQALQLIDMALATFVNPAVIQRCRRVLRSGHHVP